MNDVVKIVEKLIKVEIDKHIPGSEYIAFNTTDYTEHNWNFNVICKVSVYIKEENLLASMLTLDFELEELYNVIQCELMRQGYSVRVMLEIRNSSHLWGMNSNLIYAC